uniref:NIDO domain-containing protein n=2 Tax=Parascaris univalens TaxID=6257 RepID=A0A915BIP2_PARUN
MRRWPQLLLQCCYFFAFCFAIWFIVSIDAQQIAPAQVPIAAAPAAQVLPQPIPVVPVAPPNVLPGQPVIGPQLTPFYAENLVPFGPEVGDHEVFPGMLNPGQMIDLHMFFPFYGGLYNYSIISVNGYIGFAHIFNQGPVLNVGVENTDWPRQPDPAMIAPWLCKQQITQEPQPGMRAGVFFRLVLRRSLFGRPPNELLNVAGVPLSSFFNQPANQACPGTPDSYIQCNQQSDLFLELMMQWLQEGVAGAVAFRADAALVVTWLNTASGISGRSDLGLGQLATYQAIWLTDQTARLSYVILNYDKLGFDADDFRFNSRNGRCQALFNGGNHTGTVPVDPTIPYKHSPKILARRSGVPHLARGRYMFRVDDVVRPGGCSNKTAGTYPMLIYPNIVNMLGETTVDVNALCLERSQTYILMIEQRETATCIVLNSAIARCFLPRVFDWGTKTVYFQTQQGNLNAQEDKAFVGYIYFVPPTIDPMRLDIGNTYDWFKNPIPFQMMPISWYPRNFTNPDYFNAEQIFQIANDAMYSVQLGLYVIGYREAQDNKVEQWYLNEWERMNEMFTYRFGYMKLAPLRPNDVTGMNLLPGYAEDGAQYNFIRYTETNASCPCVESQAKIDLGYVQGAGSFTTLDNRKFVFNEPGVFTLLHIPQTLTNPEVRIQIRLERYPNRRVDFGLFGRYISQADLVQPTNATVVTGIALEATGTDRVVVVARKDTRRYRYRTSVIVGNIIRYFDNMKLQKFKGVLVYVNNVEYGQAEVYVVLEAAQIGVRIRESYALDIARLPMYYESMGLLDIELSVPPRYGVQPSGERPFGATPFPTMFQFPPVSGLMRPNPEGQPGLLNVPLTLNEVNSANIVQQLVTSYRIPGGAGAGMQPAGLLAVGVPTENLFTTSQENYKKYDVFPEAAIKALPIYKTAERFESGPYRFIPKDGMMINQLLQTCRDLQLNPPLNPVPVQRQIVQQYGTSECPNNPAEIISNCGDSVPCLYDYTMLNSKTLGIEALNAWNNFVIDRTTGSRHYNSCGAIMIEYPAYMLKTPSLASGYLQDDIASFSCYQTHWIKGDYEYKCGLVADYQDPTRYTFQWNKGWQPWCRSREKDNMFQWLTAIFTTVGIIMMIAVVFLAFWCIKQKRRSESEEKIFRESTTFAPTISESYPSREKTVDGEVFHISRPRSPQTGTVLDRGRVYDTNPGPSRTSTPPSAELRSRRAGLMGFKTSV